MSLKRDEIANPDSCLNRAADGEPIFVLRANDPIAARVVRMWADEYSMEKTLSSTDGIMTHAQLSKAQEARGTANMMDAWRQVERSVRVEEPKVEIVQCMCGKRSCPTCNPEDTHRYLGRPS